MWILYILAALALLIALILLMPVRIIIKSDQSGEPQFLVRVLFLTFGKKKTNTSNKKSKSADSAKKELGVDTFNLKNLKQQIKEKGLKETVSQILHILADIARSAVSLLHHCTAEKFEFKVAVSGDDAAVAAIKYGACCAVIYPLINVIGTLITIKEKGTKIDILCDYSGAEEKISYNFVIKVRVFRVLFALLGFLFKQYKRKNEKENKDAPKPKNIVS